MKFKTVSIKNFCSFKSANFEMDDKGLVLILGENLDASKADSNGSGKSLLFDSLCWCLWGNTVRDIKGDKVVNRTVGKNCVVTVTFTEDDNEYVVIRHQKDKDHFKENDLELFVNGTSGCKGSIADTQKVLNSILGLDFNTFRAMMPGAGIRAAEMTDKSIKALLESLLQTELLSSAHILAKNKLKAVSGELDKAENDLTRYKEDLASHKAVRATYEEKNNDFDSNKKSVIERASSELAEAKLRLNSLETDLEAKLFKLREDIDSFKKTLSSYDELDELTRKSINSIREETHKIHSSLQETRSSYAAKLKIYEKNRENIERAKDICPHCSQKVTEEHRLSSIESLDSEIKLCINMLAVIDNRIKTSRLQMEEKLNPLRDTESLNSEKINKVKRLINKLENDITISTECSKADSLYLRNKIKEQESILKEQEKLDNPFSSLLISNSEDIVKVESKIKDLILKIKDLRLEEENLEFWVDGFSARGIRSYMLKHVTPILNDRAEQYCQALTDGEMKIIFETEKSLKNGNVVEDFNIIVIQGDYGADSYKGCSGGEKARADLVISLVLGDLASFRANKKIPFRFIDEAFELVDDTGLESVVSLLKSQQDKYESIFVVTHKSELKQHFSNVLQVQKKNGVSTIV